MWVLRRHKVSLQLCVLAACLLVVLHWIYRYSNAIDLVLYATSSELKGLPLSIQCNLGRLGNQMCTYATLYGLSGLLHRRPVTLSCNVNHLKDIFVGPSEVQSKKNVLYFKINAWNISSYLKPEDLHIPQNSNFLSGYKYPCSFTFFDHAKDDIRRQFRFKDSFVQYAQAVLQKANIQRLGNATYVGVHVRRGDYMSRWLDVFEGVPVNMEYFQQAFRYFRDKYKDVIFVAVSDDRTWCIKNIAGRFGAYVPEEVPSPAHDMAILANCNHTILSYGTFGFWGAYLAGGEVLYFDKFLKPNTSFTRQNFLFEKMYPPRWKGIVTVNDSHWRGMTGTVPDGN